MPSGARILVAEDNDTNSEVIVGLLQQLGYRAECVSNGAGLCGVSASRLSSGTWC